MKKIAFAISLIFSMAGCSHKEEIKTTNPVTETEESTMQPSTLPNANDSTTKADNKPVQPTTAETELPAQTKNEISYNKTALEKAVFDTIENDSKVDGAWDKKVTIDSLHASNKAAIGSWWAKDQWSWIAWQKSDGTWEVLLDMDGFECEALQAIPKEFDNFFDAAIKSEDGTPYCY